MQINFSNDDQPWPLASKAKHSKQNCDLEKRTHYVTQVWCSYFKINCQVSDQHCKNGQCHGANCLWITCDCVCYRAARRRYVRVKLNRATYFLFCSNEYNLAHSWYLSQPGVVYFFQAGVLFSSWCTFLQRECDILAYFGCLWPILAFLLRIYAIFGIFLDAQIVWWCTKIDKYQVCQGLP